MDLYGVQIKLDDGTDMVAQLAPMFILDYIEGEVSGSRTYEVSNGLALNVIVNNMQTNHSVTRAEIVGNRVDFECFANSSIIVCLGGN